MNLDLVFDKSGMSFNGVPLVMYSRDNYDFTNDVVTALNKPGRSSTLNTEMPATSPVATTGASEPAGSAKARRLLLPPRKNRRLTLSRKRTPASAGVRFAFPMSRLSPFPLARSTWCAALLTSLGIFVSQETRAASNWSSTLTRDPRGPFRAAASAGHLCLWLERNHRRHIRSLFSSRRSANICAGRARAHRRSGARPLEIRSQLSLGGKRRDLASTRNSSGRNHAR